jgi:Flp pilus assembly protein TadB
MAPLTSDHGATDLVRLHVAAGVALGPDLVLSPRVRRAVDIAQDVGGPLLATLDAATEAEDDALRAIRAVAVATAQARTVAGGLVLAPVLLVPLIGRIAGVDLRAFYTSPPGRMVLLVGLGLLGLGAGVARGLVARAVRPATGVLVEEAVELTAVAVAAGAATPEALRLAGTALPELRDPLTRLALDIELGIRRDGTIEVLPGMARLRTVLATATAIGAPTLEALRRLARDLRAAELARVLAAAERIPAQLTFPTTLLLLPATVLLIAAPLIAGGLRGVVT